MKKKRMVAGCLSVATIFFCGKSFAQLNEYNDTIELGYSAISPNSDSSDLSGPARTTPPGVKTTVRNSSTLTLSYTRRIYGPWSAMFLAGLPPTMKFNGSGTASRLGEVASARVWLPAILIRYDWDGLGKIRPYLAAGVNYTWLTKTRMTDSYNHAFGGISSTSSFGSSVGPVVKVGVDIPFAQRWSIGLSYTHYWIRSMATIRTDTPGLGSVERKVSVTGDPDVFALTVGYRF
ncbi:OmpW family protein [Burkholderia pseudomallei]|uniref:OmpW/AlkL family protein n=1 Tax=Burkholderia pseudomallei TaxID=28450 RepID=UPI001AD7A9B7|nr:OmpW family outer membrane protein [Burkholderia pseudomallei]MBO7934230.1 OmpW family protein [Burkholderia pseudomallei]